MTVTAGVDVGNATTEVAVVDGDHLLGTDRLPTRGRKGSPESLGGAAALVRRIERRLGCRVEEARIAPLRAADTTTLTIPRLPAPAGRLRLLAAAAATPGGTGAFAGVPLWLDQPPVATPDSGRAAPAVAVVPAGLGYAQAAERLRGLLAAGVPVGAVLVAADEGVLIANRLPTRLPVIDEVDVSAVGACALVAVEARAPGQPLSSVADPVALAAAFSLTGDEAMAAATFCRSLVDHSNAVVGYTGPAPAQARPVASPGAPWVVADGERIPLRTASMRMAGWPVGTIQAFGTGQGQTEVDDLFALDLDSVADTATARRGKLGQAFLVACLSRMPGKTDQAGVLADMLGRPVRCRLTEPAAARLGALTTPGAHPDAVVVDAGAGTIDVIAPDGEVVAAGAGELLTAAVAQTFGIPRAAADWVKRGPSVRVDGGRRFEAEDGSRGFLDRPAPVSAAGMLAVPGPAGLLPFDRGHSPAEWRAVRLRMKQAVFAANLRRALDSLDARPPQLLIVGGPAGDEELLGVLLRYLPDNVAVGRGNVGGTLNGPPAGHRYAAALGLALAR